jgi:hypothetical protein
MSLVLLTGNMQDGILSTRSMRRLSTRPFEGLVGLDGQDGAVEVGSRENQCS